MRAVVTAGHGCSTVTHRPWKGVFNPALVACTAWSVLVGFARRRLTLPRRLIHTPYELNFRVERDHTVLCTKELSGRELKKFRKVCSTTYRWDNAQPNCSTWTFLSRLTQLAELLKGSHAYAKLFFHTQIDLLHR